MLSDPFSVASWFTVRLLLPNRDPGSAGCSGGLVGRLLWPAPLGRQVAPAAQVGHGRNRPLRGIRWSPLPPAISPGPCPAVAIRPRPAAPDGRGLRSPVVLGRPRMGQGSESDGVSRKVGDSALSSWASARRRAAASVVIASASAAASARGTAACASRPTPVRAGWSGLGRSRHRLLVVPRDDRFAAPRPAGGPRLRNRTRPLARKPVRVGVRRVHRVSSFVCRAGRR